MSSESFETVMRRRRILFVGFVVHMEDTRLAKSVMFGKLMRGAGKMVGGDRRSQWGLPEISRGSAALTGVARDGDGVSRVVQEKTAWDDPIPEMAAVEPIYYYYSVVYLQYTNT